MAAPIDILRKVDAMWSNPEEKARVLGELQRYGLEPYEREVERVQLAILKLCESKIGRVSELVAAAKNDYRDVLMWAECPGEGQALWTLRPGLSTDEKSRLEELRCQDRKQYRDWLEK